LLFGQCLVCLVARIIAQEPDKYRGHHDDTSHLLEVLGALLPCVAQDGFAGGHTVGGQFHYEGCIVALHQQAAEEACHENGQQDACCIDAEQHGAGILVEEGSDEQQVDGQAGTARHQRIDEHGDEAALAVLDGASGHDGGHIASEAHDEWDERFAVKPHLVHQFVHDESGAGHIARVLHQADEEIEDEDVGKKDDDSAHTSDDTVDNHVLQWSLSHVGLYQVSNLFHQPFDAHHGVFTQHKGAFEHDVEKEEEDGESPPTVGDNGVDGFRQFVTLQVIVGESFA